MDILSTNLLSIIIYLPLLGIPLIMLVKDKRTISVIATATTLITFLISLLLLPGFDAANGGFQFVEKSEWLPAYGIEYLLGLDGISLLLVILTTFLSLVAVISSYTAVETRYRDYMVALLALEVGMNGVFAALDLFLFYIFWEVILIPMFLLIGIWGGKNRHYASLKFFLYTLAGSTLMLVATIYLAFEAKAQTGMMSFSLVEIQKLHLPVDTQLLLFIAFAIAFAIKVPLFPVHTWLPDAHTEAPTAGSVILAGVLLKMGTYGFLRFNLPLFPDATVIAAPAMGALSVIGIIYGAWMALVQTDVKRLVAYSSVSHLGFVMLGIFALNPEGLTGGVLQSLNHGVSTGMLFLLVGMVYERRHTRLIAEYGGIAKVMPLFAIYMMIATLSSIGLPGTNGFVGEFMILVGGFLSNNLYGILAATGVIFGAVYMLWMYQRVFLGEITVQANEGLKDLNLREHLMLIPLVVLIFALGVFPSLATHYFDASVSQLTALYPQQSRPSLTPQPQHEEEPSQEEHRTDETKQDGAVEHVTRNETIVR